MEDKKIILDIINKLPLFDLLDEGEKKQFAVSCYIKQFNSGEVIFKEGDDGGDLFIVVEGEISIKKNLTPPKEIVLAKLQPFEFFGEMDTLIPGENKRNASAQAEVNTKLFVLPKSVFQSCMKDGVACSYKLSYYFAVILAKRLRKMDEEYIKVILETKGEKAEDELKLFREKLIKEWDF